MANNENVAWELRNQASTLHKSVTDFLQDTVGQVDAITEILEQAGKQHLPKPQRVAIQDAQTAVQAVIDGTAPLYNVAYDALNSAAGQVAGRQRKDQP